MFLTLLRQSARSACAGDAARISRPHAGARGRPGRTCRPTSSTRLARALLVKDERNLDKFDVVFAATFKGVLHVAAAVEAKELPEEWLRRMAEKLPQPRGAGRDREARLREADGDAAPAPRRAEGPPSGRLEMDRHGRNLAVRRLWRPSRGRADRAGRRAAAAARSRSGTSASSRISTATRSLGRATSSSRCSRLRRFAREGAAGRARSRRHDPLDRRQGLYRRPAAARAAQCGQGAAVPRRRRLDGLARRGGRAAVLGREEPVQAARAFLLPQLPLRERVEEQPPPPRGARRRRAISSIPTAATIASSSSATPR